MMEYKDRIPAGDSGERMAAELLRRLGHEVEMAPHRVGDWDLRADGKTIDVKAATYTESRGSDGYPIRGFVFANLHQSPKVEYYLLLCLSPDRSKILTYYLIPSSMARQRTLTLTATKARELEAYKEVLTPLRKDAAQKLYSESLDRQERHATYRFVPRYNTHQERLVDYGGVAAGALVFGGLNGFRDRALGRRQMGLSEAAAGVAAVVVGRAATRLLVMRT